MTPRLSSKRPRPFLSLGACHGADAVRFALTGVGSVIGGSVLGFVKFGIAGRRADDALALAVLGSTIGAGVGVVKTFEDWEPGVAGCLSDRGYVFAPAAQSNRAPGRRARIWAGGAARAHVNDVY